MMPPNMPGDLFRKEKCEMTTLAKKIFLVLLLVCMALPAVVGCGRGCGESCGEGCGMERGEGCGTFSGVGTTEPENKRMVWRVQDYDCRMLHDDLMLLSQTRRPWHGSRVPIK